MGKQSEDAPFLHRSIIGHATKALVKRRGSMSQLARLEHPGEGGLGEGGCLGE
jgi:hypothetical protein